MNRPSKPKQKKHSKAKVKRQSVGQVRAERASRVKEKSLDELLSIVEDVKKALPSEDYETLVALINTFVFTSNELSKKRVALKRLQKILFGETSEKTAAVLANFLKDDEAAQNDSDKANDSTDDEANVSESDAANASVTKPKRKGHGRRSAAEYTGAQKTAVPHETLSHKDACPQCETGTVYTMKQPAVVVRVTGVGPLAATVHEMERLRCNLCGKIFQAAAPQGVGTKKYDVSVIIMIALLKYGYGMPFKRLEALSGNMGIPLPAGTQWELVEAALEPFEAVANELSCAAAQGEVLYIDDTKMKVLDLHAALAKKLKGKGARTGVRTSGIVSTLGERKIALFYTGEKHAGENLADVLAFRDAKLASPIQMADALACNTSHDFEVIIAKCLVHGRRKFVDVVHNFPAEVVHVVRALRTVFFNEATTKKEGLGPDERLAYHKLHSKPVMDELKTWMRQKIEGRDVEPNSSLGKAINYMNKHWEGLTRFLTVAGAPMENNTVERALKWAIRHRRNSLFYKTIRGAKVGDTYMTLLYTADLNDHNGWDYLLAIAKHPQLVIAQPQNWLPWTYEATLKLLTAEK